MPDQEISELLSTLGELSGENTGDDEESTENKEDQSSEETSETPADAAGTDLDGIDMFDTDLSAMLDDVTSSLENTSDGDSTGAGEDSDYFS